MNRFVCALFMSGLIYDSGAAIIDGGLEYLSDNTAFIRPLYYLSAKNLSVPGGELSLNADYAHWAMRSSFSGIRKFTSDIAHAEAGYRFSTASLSSGITLSAGVFDPGSSNRFYAGAEIPVRKTFRSLPGFRLLSTAGVQCGFADDNPFMAKMGANKLSLSLDAGAGINLWEFHAAYGYAKYDPIERDAYKSLLDDPEFFSVFYDTLNPLLHLVDAQTAPFPANESRSFSMYFFGPVTPALYLGASYAWKNTASDFYLPLADNDDGTIEFVFFPYHTPHHEGSFNAIAAYAYQTDDMTAVINKLSLKTSFPVYSYGTYRGYYQAAPGNILAGFNSFYYNYYGTGTLTADAEIAKKLSPKFTAGFVYSWVSRPYVAYHFFGSDSYRYQNVRLLLRKDF